MTDGIGPLLTSSAGALVAAPGTSDFHVCPGGRYWQEIGRRQFALEHRDVPLNERRLKWVQGGKFAHALAPRRLPYHKLHDRCRPAAHRAPTA